MSDHHIEVEDSFIKLSDVYREHKKGLDTISVLNGLDFTIEKKDFIAIMGPSGTGKTTLLNLIGGLDRPSAGSVSIGGTLINRYSSNQLAQWRSQHVGFVFQFYNLLPVLTAHQNVELPLSLMSLSKADRKRRVDAALKVVGLDDRSKHYPNELSGGQQQRVAIARAIVTDPSILLCDEPTGDLDQESGESVLALLQTLNQEYGKAVVMVTHDHSAASYANRRVFLQNGKLQEEVVGS
jgi:putative ABC transport system ATP-binding protein